MPELIDAPLEICVNASMHKGKPAITLRRFSVDPQINKALLYATLKGQSVTVKLVFKKPHLQIGNCIDKGLLSRDKDGFLKFVDLE